MSFLKTVLLIALGPIHNPSRVLGHYDENCADNLARFCGRDENGTVIGEPGDWGSACEDPRREMTSHRPPSGGTVFTGAPEFGPTFGHISYFQVGDVHIGFACDGVLLVESIWKNMRPGERYPSIGNLVYQGAQTVVDGQSNWGAYWSNRPVPVGMRCLVETLPEIANSSSIHHARHGTPYNCTICDEDSPFDCPTEFERYYLDAELTYREGNVCEYKYGPGKENRTWFGYLEQYYQPNMAVWFVSNGQVSELGPGHPFMPNHYCRDDGNPDDCPCSLPAESPVYPDSLYGGSDPTFSLPVVLKGFPTHSRRLGQRLSGCGGPTVIQAVFKLSADASWETNPTVDYRGVNTTVSMGVNEFRNDVLTPALYVSEGTPKMSGLLNPRLLQFKDDQVNLIRCIIDPNEAYETEEEQYVNGKPKDCVVCGTTHSRVNDTCVTPSLMNGSSPWILDTVLNFQPVSSVPTITVPPGFDVTLAGYNASSTHWAANSTSTLLRWDDIPSFRDALLPQDVGLDDPTWTPFEYRHNGPP